ncbi:hypothetical protein QAD02_010426 [Eretmocerus hayati]|uniref:Uncharacterized protein n=1 Tax=Eretmocerus hayati TaxID=131215 RepID=A0ACC2NYL6_9HYME|nr:hypothetical protein QAD02_010426 [Eretmocerus hayati]
MVGVLSPSTDRIKTTKSRYNLDCIDNDESLLKKNLFHKRKSRESIHLRLPKMSQKRPHNVMIDTKLNIKVENTDEKMNKTEDCISTIKTRYFDEGIIKRFEDPIESVGMKYIGEKVINSEFFTKTFKAEYGDDPIETEVPIARLETDRSASAFIDRPGQFVPQQKSIPACQSSSSRRYHDSSINSSLENERKKNKTTTLYRSISYISLAGCQGIFLMKSRKNPVLFKYPGDAPMSTLCENDNSHDINLEWRFFEVDGM